MISYFVSVLHAVGMFIAIVNLMEWFEHETLHSVDIFISVLGRSLRSTGLTGSWVSVVSR